MRMNIAPVLVVAILAMTLSVLPARADTDVPAITTTGEATVYVVPDKVIVNLGVQTFHANLDQAKAMNERAGTSLLAAIKALAIDPSDIGTDRLEVEIRYRDSYRNNFEIEGYLVTRGYAVTLKDTSLFEKLIDAALKNGSNRVYSVSFETTELRKHRDQARQMAIRASREKAVDLAGALDATIGKPITITESSSGSYYYRNSMYGNLSQNVMQNVPATADTGESLPLGKIAVRASVSVKYELK